MVAGGQPGQKGRTTGSAGGWDCTSKRCQSRPPHRVRGNSTRPIFVHSSGIPPGCIRNPDRQPVVVPPSAPNDAPSANPPGWGCGIPCHGQARRDACPPTLGRCQRRFFAVFSGIGAWIEGRKLRRSTMFIAKAPGRFPPSSVGAASNSLLQPQNLNLPPIPCRSYGAWPSWSMSVL